MAIVLQKDRRVADSILGRVFCDGRYYGDFSVDSGCNPTSSFEAGCYSLISSIYSDDAVDVLDTKGRTVATLTYRKPSVSKLCILVGQEGLTFRTCKRSFEAIKELYEGGSARLVIREPLVMKA